jgi:oxalate decarboxylase family bicupin protein
VDESVFGAVPSPNPVIDDGLVNTEDIDSPFGKLEGNLSTIFRASQIEPTIAPGGGGSVKVVDSRNFPIVQTIASAIVTLKPGALHELHWHPNVGTSVYLRCHVTDTSRQDEEWLFFLSGHAKATVFMGASAARPFDFLPGHTAVFPDISGHYVENTSEAADLVWIEIYNSDRALSISLAQWLALTPAPIVAQKLNLPEEFVRSIKDEAQFAVA